MLSLAVIRSHCHGFLLINGNGRHGQALLIDIFNFVQEVRIRILLLKFISEIQEIDLTI